MGKHKSPCTPEVRKIRSLARQRAVQKQDENWLRTYIITTPNGDEIKVPNLTKYCCENGLKYENMKNVVYGKAQKHKGYTCVQLGANGPLYRTNVPITKPKPIITLSPMQLFMTSLVNRADNSK